MTALKVAMRTLIGSGVVLLALGAILWSGSDELIVVHVVLGVTLVLSLWTICAIAARAGVSATTVAFAAGWGWLAFALGLWQEELLSGDLHWVIQVLHVVIGMGAIWWGRRLAKAIHQRALERSQTSAPLPPLQTPAIR